MIVTRTISAFFQDDDGNKVTGLSPTVTIFDITNGGRITVGTFTMLEDIAAAVYGYTYTSFNTEKQYLFMFDGGASLSNINRYKIGGVEGQENLEIKLEEIKTSVQGISSAENIITFPM